MSQSGSFEQVSTQTEPSPLPELIETYTRFARDRGDYTAYCYVMRVADETGRGIPYDVRVFQPDVPIIDTAVMRTLPWKTQNDGVTGFEPHLLARRGVPVVLIGAEGSCYDTATPPDIRRRQSAGLTVRGMGRSALALFQGAVARHDYDPTRFIGTGASRGAILQTAVAGAASQAGIEVVYAELSALEGVAPEPIEGVNLKKFYAECAVGAAAELAVSALIHPDHVRHFMRYAAATRVRTPHGFRHFSDAMLPQFLSGDVGDIIRNEIPRDYHAHSEVFSTEANRTLDAQRRAFAEHPNAVIKVITGNHAGCMGLSAIGRRVMRLTELAHQLHEGATPKGVDWQLVHTAHSRH